ncbi:hypothetical protein [Hydrogenophaga sp. 5NK40-0174]|uniref:DUF6976 family protein n=1 Tax=Hydrogenophaga sp. 5NK40-0174 TaxID=3127649 RepID=UPI003101E56F
MNARTAPAQIPGSGTLMTLDEAKMAIGSGLYLSIAADESLLRQLPAGNWMAGSIPYFMGQTGGATSRDRLFVSQMPVMDTAPTLRWYDVNTLRNVALDGPSNGLSVLIVPAFSDVHSSFAREAPSYEDMYLKPLVGWIAGIHLDDLGSAAPVLANGQTLEFSTTKALAMHVPLPESIYPRIEILNLFEQGDGDVIRFPSTGFSAKECTVNGRMANLAQYLTENKIDTRLPLVADYSGAMINVSFKAVDEANGVVDFYAPVFDDIDYRIARPVPDYAKAFAGAMPQDAQNAGWACNCILNYLYGELEGKRTGTVTGPMTFGEIAYQLLNQTMVYVSLETI